MLFLGALGPAEIVLLYANCEPNLTYIPAMAPLDTSSTSKLLPIANEQDCAQLFRCLPDLII